MRLNLIIAAIPVLLLATPALAEQNQHWQADQNSVTVFAQLASAKEYVDRLPAEESPQARQILIRSAIDALTALHQLYGCEWAEAKLVELYSLPDCPEFVIGYTADGRIRLQIEKLELKNPVFEGYSFFLVTLESQTSLLLEAETAASLQFETASGETLTADQINSKHSLWPNLERSAGAYEPVSRVLPGAGLSYKQVFSTEISGSTDFRAVLLDWGNYQIKLPRYGVLELKQDG